MDSSYEVASEARAGVSSKPKETSPDGQTALEMATQQVKAAPQQVLPDIAAVSRSCWKQSPWLGAVSGQPSGAAEHLSCLRATRAGELLALSLC